MKLYKLTNQDMTTYNNTRWVVGEAIEAKGDVNQPLCSDGWIHAYEHPWIALLINPIHGNFPQPRLFEAEGQIGKRDGQFKCGCRSLTLIRELHIPTITTEQRVEFAIRCAVEVYPEPTFQAWATEWLSGINRTEKAARAAARAAAEAATEAARAAAEAAAEAARAAYTINIVLIAKQVLGKFPY